jgi:hypothetical protein
MKRYIALMFVILIIPTAMFAQRKVQGTSRGVQGGTLAPQPGINIVQNVTLTIVTNPDFAQVLINGEPLNGRRTVGLRPGTYNVTVRADGYQDFTTMLNVTSDMVFPVTLQTMSFQLQVNVSNVTGAQVIINGVVAGQAPFFTSLSPGSYSLTVRAPGFLDYVESFALNGNKSINITLQGMNATFQIMTNAANINPDDRFGGSGVQVYIDGVLQRGTSGQLMPGRRLLRVVSGGLQAESFVDVQAGRSYVFEPFMGVTVK